MPRMLTRLIWETAPQTAEEACQMASGCYERADYYYQIFRFPDPDPVFHTHCKVMYEIWYRRAETYKCHARRLTQTQSAKKCA